MPTGLSIRTFKDLIASGFEGNKNIERFECSVFDGEYITGDVDKNYLGRIEALRNDAAKEKARHLRIQRNNQ